MTTDHINATAKAIHEAEFQTMGALDSCVPFATQYAKDHTTPTNPAFVAIIAAGRLELLLRITRPELSGVFSVEDIATLLNCTPGHFFTQRNVACLATMLCE